MHCMAGQAQKENNVWVFGDSMGIDFNGPTPTIIKTSIRTLGGSAAVSNSDGQLLFYTQGDHIWNRNHQLMPSGSDLIAPYVSNDGGSQSSQGQLILPVIGDTNKYYVFSMQTVIDYLYNSDVAASRLYYSIVDMTLDGGLGDVVPGKKGILLDSLVTSDKMIAIRGTDCNLWLLVHNVEDNVFKAYHIGDTGISLNPVISATGNIAAPLGYVFGKMKASPDGTRLAVCNYLMGEYGCELYDFDPATGTVSNPQVLDSIPQDISACFSPEGTKLYVFTFDGGNGALYQYDLTHSNIADVIASATLIDQLTDAGALVYDAAIGPDNKIYVKMPYSGVTSDTIGRIDFPDVAGTACGYTRAALVSPWPIQLGNGDLPNMFVKPKQDTTFISNTTTIPMNGTVTLDAPAGYDNYSWSNGDHTASITVNNTGTYWVNSSSYCEYRTDTFVVTERTGVNDVAANGADIRLFPNPAATQVTIQITDGTTANGLIRIADMTGRVVYQTSVTAREVAIPLHGIAGGVYEVTYDAGNAHLQRKLVITK
jgi:hypothetical protein